MITQKRLKFKISEIVKPLIVHYLNITIILSNNFSNSSSDASLFPARNFESTNFAINSAGLFCRVLINDSQDSFMDTINVSFDLKHSCMIVSNFCLKSNNSCTIVLSFSGLTTIRRPRFFTKSHSFPFNSLVLQGQVKIDYLDED